MCVSVRVIERESSVSVRVIERECMRVREKECVFMCEKDRYMSLFHHLLPSYFLVSSLFATLSVSLSVNVCVPV